MARRLVIDCNAASPMRVSVSGVDADAAEFNDLIFDGNQSPLRLWGVGYAFADGISYNEFTGGQNAREGSAVVVASSPEGTTPIFVCTVVKAAGAGFMWTPYRINAGTDGGGGSICRASGVNYFIPLCFNVGPPGAPTSRASGMYCNYAIMKNWT